jgi:hypothetical protein
LIQVALSTVSDGQQLSAKADEQCRLASRAARCLASIRACLRCRTFNIKLMKGSRSELWALSASCWYTNSWNENEARSRDDSLDFSKELFTPFPRDQCSFYAHRPPGNPLYCQSALRTDNVPKRRVDQEREAECSADGRFEKEAAAHDSGDRGWALSLDRGIDSSLIGQ